MAIPQLPVWSIRPNWKGGVLERLEWHTRVLSSSTGTEQRTALRFTPRRSFEVAFNPVDRERTFMDLWLNRLATNECLFPLFHDKARLVEAVVPGNTRLNFDNTFREFVTGGWAVIYSDAFNFEVVEIDDQDSEGLDLAGPIGRKWAKAKAVYPLRRMTLDHDALSLGAITNRLGSARILFTTTEANPYDVGYETLQVHDGYPVLTIEPNRIQSLDQILSRLAFQIDNRMGKRHTNDEGGRAFSSMQYNWQLRGRKERHRFRQLLYRLNGRQKALWLPTFNQDLHLAQAATAADEYVRVQHVGYGYVGGPASGRDRFMIKTSTGIKIARVNAMGVVAHHGTERLNLSAALGGDAPVGRSASFVDIARLDQDTIEILHRNDLDGMAECTVALKTFKNTRDASGTIFLPIPDAAMSGTPCGNPAEDGEISPCDYVGGYLINPSFESGDITGWASAMQTCIVYPHGGSSSGGAGNADPPYLPPAHGAWCVGGINQALPGAIRQEFDIPSEYWDAIDAGQCEIQNVGAYGSSPVYGPAGTQVALSVFLGGVSQNYSTGYIKGNPWTLQACPPMLINPGNRRVRISGEFGEFSFMDNFLQPIFVVLP